MMTDKPDELIRQETAQGALSALEISIVLGFERIVELYPENVAVKDHESALTYRELNAEANKLAHALLESGDLQDEAPVAFLFGHEIWGIVALIGILKAGHPYVALTPALPAELLESMLSDSTSRCLISSRRYGPLADALTRSGALGVVYLEDLQGRDSGSNPQIYVSPDAPFGIYYTSGSTGDSKGVVHNHGMDRHLMRYRLQEYQLSPRDRVGLLVSLGFQHASSIIMEALLCGGCLGMFDIRTQGLQKVLQWINSEQITVASLSPTVLQATFEHAPPGYMCPSLRIVRLSGEVVRAADIAVWKAHTAEHCICYVSYASTEVGLVTSFKLTHESASTEDNPPVGFPIPGNEIMLLDDNGDAVPPLVDGEIVVRSVFVSSAYWRRPDLTARKFFPAPGHPELRLYYTGDVGRLRADGSLEFRGRKDTQVKIRGVKVEVSEVEAALSRNAAVRSVHVGARPSKHQPDQLQIIAYVVLNLRNSVTAGELRQYLTGKLPPQAVPSFIVFLDHLPINPNGKVDRLALPDIPERPELSADDQPDDEFEAKLVEIWSRLLGVDRIGVHDSFFELGGDSLSVLVMTLEVEKAMGLPVPQTFFREPTIRGILKFAGLARPSEPAPGRFELQDSRITDNAPRARQKKRALYSHYLESLATQRTSLPRKLQKVGRYIVENRLVDILVARYLITKPFLEARAWAMRWGQNAAVQKLIFSRRRRLFARFLEHTGNPDPPSSESFGRNIAACMLFSIEHWWENPLGRDGWRASTWPYWQTLAKMLEEIPVGSVDGELPVTEAEHVVRAFAAGKGVILLSMHGAPFSGGSYRIARLLGCEPIPTISYAIAHELRLHNLHGATDPVEHSALRAEIAFFGQSRLRAGGLINILPDVEEGHGTTGWYSVLGKKYWFKSGFAELALNTGAAVVPYYHARRPDGRVQTRIEAPFVVPDLPREAQIRSLLGQYANFMERAFQSDPETWYWVKMEMQLSLPPVNELSSR
jgi:amino acid adenylation domain-containing protein